jgi:hypothetical protein
MSLKNMTPSGIFLNLKMSLLILMSLHVCRSYLGLKFVRRSSPAWVGPVMLELWTTIYLTRRAAAGLLGNCPSTFPDLIHRLELVTILGVLTDTVPILSVSTDIGLKSRLTPTVLRDVNFTAAIKAPHNCSSIGDGEPLRVLTSTDPVA